MKIMSESYVETCIDWTSFYFIFKDFFSSLAESAETIDHSMCYRPGYPGLGSMCWPGALG